MVNFTRNYFPFASLCIRMSFIESASQVGSKHPILIEYTNSKNIREKIYIQVFLMLTGKWSIATDFRIKKNKYKLLPWKNLVRLYESWVRNSPNSQNVSPFFFQIKISKYLRVPCCKEVMNNNEQSLDQFPARVALCQTKLNLVDNHSFQTKQAVIDEN